MIRVVLGLFVGVPIGWLLAEIRRGWRAGSTPADVPPFAAELEHAPRHPCEWL